MKLEKNNQKFQWIGEGVPLQKRGSKIHHEAFSIGDLKIGIGEYVLVRNDDALDPEDVMSCYVAQLKNLFDTGDEFDPYQAQVQWFSRVTELPTYAIKSLKNVGHEFEVIKDKRSSWYDMIDAETVFQKCEVLFLAVDANYESVLSEYSDHPFPVFFCRYAFTGTSAIEVKDKDKCIINIPRRSKSVAEKVLNCVTPEKNRPQKTDNMYCAISVGSPSKCPKVLIRKIDDKILESRNGNVRIFVADSNVEKVEDVANIFLSKLKLEKEEHSRNLEKNPIIHSLTSQSNISKENIHETNDELMDYDCSVKSENTFNTPKSRRNYCNRKNATPLSTNSCKSLFTYNTRNSPRKNTPLKNSNVYSTPTKKARVMLDELRLKSSNQKMAVDSSDKANVGKFSEKAAFEKDEHSNSEKQPVIHSFTSENHNSDDSEYETNAELMISDSETESRTLETPKTRKSCISKKNPTPSHYRSYKKIVTEGLKDSPKKNTALGKSDTYSTPKKRAKFTDVLEDFCLTRSGRRVKAVNYSEQQNETKRLISSVTPTKTKLPRFVRSSCSEDSDSSNFTSGKDTYDDDDDDSSLSGLSLLNETSPNETKSSVKKKNKAASKKSLNKLKVRTPTSRKSVVNLYIPERKTPFRTPKNALEESRQRLHVSAVPNSLPCRDEEYSDIYSFVKGCLCAQTGGCMYISGVPGTGKTATVHEVMRNLEEEKELGEIPIFTFVEVNGMWMTDPYQCYVQIFKALTGKSIAPQQAADLLEKRFTERGPKKDAVVLLVDELDRLWTRKQTVMYNIFDWPTKKYSKLIVLAIANTMDLPERMMMNRISSRLGLTRKTFQPYTFKQLQEIIMSRIQELKVFDPDAVQLVARKVAAVSGDARRALDICRFATETVKMGQTAKKGQKILVGMEHVDTALQQMFSSPVISAIRSSSKIAKLFFQCLLSEFTRTGLEETTLLKVNREVFSTCKFEGLQPPSSTEISRMCADLAASHLILVDNFRNDLYMKIRLNISSDDVTYALTLK